MSIHHRTCDPVKTLIALRALCARLQPLVAAQRSAAELDALRQRAPASDGAAVQAILEAHTWCLPPPSPFATRYRPVVYYACS